MTEASITIDDISTSNRNVKIVKIVGQLDESNVDEKIQLIYKLVEENPGNLNIIFDFANLEYMNSKSIGYLTDIYGKITEAGGQMAIAQGKPNIIDILQVVGLTQLIRTFSTLEEAKSYIENQTGGAEIVTKAAEGNPMPASAENPMPPTAAVNTQSAPTEAGKIEQPPMQAPASSPEQTPTQNTAPATPAPNSAPQNTQNPGNTFNLNQ